MNAQNSKAIQEVIDQTIARSENATWHFDQWIENRITQKQYNAWIRANLLPAGVEFWGDKPPAPPAPPAGPAWTPAVAAACADAGPGCDDCDGCTATLPAPLSPASQKDYAAFQEALDANQVNCGTDCPTPGRPCSSLCRPAPEPPLNPVPHGPTPFLCDSPTYIARYAETYENLLAEAGRPATGLTPEGLIAKHLQEANEDRVDGWFVCVGCHQVLQKHSKIAHSTNYHVSDADGAWLCDACYQGELDADDHHLTQAQAERLEAAAEARYDESRGH